MGCFCKRNWKQVALGLVLDDRQWVKKSWGQGMPQTIMYLQPSERQQRTLAEGGMESLRVRDSNRSPQPWRNSSQVKCLENHLRQSIINSTCMPDNAFPSSPAKPNQLQFPEMSGYFMPQGLVLHLPPTQKPHQHSCLANIYSSLKHHCFCEAFPFGTQVAIIY